MTRTVWFCFLLFVFGCSADYDEYEIGRDSLEIVGGYEINIESAPFMAIYRVKGTIYGCGASIITKQFLVTAAHCTDFFGDNPAEVVVGTDNIVKGGEKHEIKAAYVHPKYIKYTHDYDVTVLQLVKKLIFTSKIQPIKMAEPGLVINEGALFQAMGFGVTNPETGKMSKVLLAVEVPYVNEAECSDDYSYMITERMICAGTKGKDSCQDDSGGPLRYDNTLIGIVSFGKGCAEEGFPGVYARVSALRDFIDYVVKEHS